MNAAPLLRQAIADVCEEMKRRGLRSGEVILSEGEFVLDAVAGDESQLIAIPGVDGLALRGQGATTRLVVRDRTPNTNGFHRKVFAMYGGRNFLLEKVAVDFAPTSRDWVQGIARNVRGPDNGSVRWDLELDPASPPFRPEAFDPARCTLLGVVLNASGQPLEDFPDAFIASDLHLRAGNTLEVTTTVENVDPKAFFEGQRVVIACRKPGEALFCFVDAVHPTLRDLTITASRGMLIEAYACDRLELDRVRLQRAEGQWLVSPGDGIHYQGGRSGPYVHDCHFEGLADDGMNLYAKPFGLAAESPGVYRTEGTPAVQPGDRIWVYQTKNGARNGQMITVSEVETDRFSADAVPESLAPDQGINISRSGQNFEVRNNSFGALRGLGCRIQTGPGIVVGNTFDRLSGSPVSLECGLHPSEAYGNGEGPFPFEIVIRDNQFSRSATGLGYGRRGIRRVAPWDPSEPHPAAFRGIHQEGNTAVEMTVD